MSVRGIIRKHIVTSLTMGVEVLSAILGIPFPLWLAFSGFAYFPPIFLVQIIICLPFLASLYMWGDSLLQTVFPNVGSGFLHGILFGVAICGIIIFGFTYWIIGKAFRRYLEHYSPWLKTVG